MRISGTSKSQSNSSRSLLSVVLLVVVVVFASTLFAPPVRAQCEATFIRPAGLGSTSFFGWRFALDGDTLVTGDHLDDENEDHSGAVYVFERVGGAWVETAKLKPTDLKSRGQFGGSPAISGDVIVAGSYLDDDRGEDSGAAYVFQRISGVWSLKAKLFASDASPSAWFGEGVAIDGNTIAVGAPGRFSGGGPNYDGAVYVFERTGVTWSQTAILRMDPREFPLGLGTEVEIDGDRIVASFISASEDDTGATVLQQGFHSFSHATGSWVPEGERVFDHTSLSLEGDTVTIGIESPDTGPAAVVFQFDRTAPNGFLWHETGRVSPISSGDGNSRYARVHLAGDTLAIAVPYEERGAVYIYRKVAEEWAALRKFTGITVNEAFSRRLGQHVVLDGSRVLAGVPHAHAIVEFDFASPLNWDCNENLIEDICETNAPVLPDCNQNEIPDECDIASGFSNDCDQNRIPDDCEPDCNGNEISDACDIASGASTDCNDNEIPDDCEPDCNNNDVADDCDIASRLHVDCNRNAVPDDCEEQPLDCFAVLGCLLNRHVAARVGNFIPSETFGISAAIAGDWAIIGDGDANRESATSAPITGRVFSYQRTGTTWTQRSELIPSVNSSTFGTFPSAVSMSGDRAMVSKFIFRREGTDWVEEAKLPTGHNASAISGDFAIFGSLGMARIARRSGTTWTIDFTLDRSAASEDDWFGMSVAISGHTAVVSAQQAPCEGTGGLGTCGAVYIYEFDGTAWSETTRILPPEPISGALFGKALAIDGNVLVVSGPPLVYRRIEGDWILDPPLFPSDPVSTSGNAPALTVDGDRVMVASVVFELDPTRTFWMETQRWTSSDAEDTLFGRAVALSGNTAVVGALSSASFIAVGGDCNGNHIADTCDIIDGVLPDGNGDNVPDDCFADCDDDGIHDPNAIANGIAMDCNDNGFPDECDLNEAASVDCNDNAIPDSCDVASGFSPDDDGNGIPDECCPIPCSLTLTLAGESQPIDKPRFISFAVQGGGVVVKTAIRFELTSLYHPQDPQPVDQPDFSVHEGKFRYLIALVDGDGIPVYECVDSSAFETSYACATLGCRPEYRDWAAIFAGQDVHVTANAIIPDSQYALVHLPPSCQGIEDACNPGVVDLMLTTARFGDTNGDSAVNMTDIVNTVDVVKQISVLVLSEIHTYSRAVDPLPHLRATGVADIVNSVDALKLAAYSLAVNACP